MPEAPKIDPRTAPDIAWQVRYFLEQYTGAKFDSEKGAAAALISIFARYSELIVERLNRVPEKNFLAFLDLLGASPVAPQPARVPLTFTLSEGSNVDTVVPAETQVAAAPAEGETEPVVFETESELVVTAARLSSIFVRDPEKDRSADRSSITGQASPDGVAIFKLDDERFNTERILYVAHDELLGHPGLKALALTFEIKTAGNVKPLKVKWETWDKQGQVSFTESDISDGGDVVFQNLSPFRSQPVNGLERYWLRGWLETPIPHAVGGKENAPPEFNPVKIIKHATLGRSGLQVEQAVANDTPVDVVKSFFPFGERPKTGDALYLAHKEAFSESGATITLHIELGNSPRASTDIDLKYEFWDGNQWSILAIESDKDAENYLTKSGIVTFTLPKLVATTINGVESFWIRVRIDTGNFGEEAHFALIDPKDPSKGFQGIDAQPDKQDDKGKPTPYGDPTKGYKLIPATYAPPLVRSLTVDYSVNKPAQPEPPEVVLTYNDFEYENQTGAKSLKPFKAMPDAYPSIYLGFELPAGREAFPQRKISIYADLYEYKFDDPPAPISIKDATTGNQPQLDWEYSTGAGWGKLLIRDGTESFTQSGLIEFFGPADFALRREFEREQFWIRAAWKAGEYQFAPKLRRLLPNTIMAAQTVTIQNEVLGSSDGSRNQKFRTTQTPVLEDQLLEVREPEEPSAAERKKIKQEPGARASFIAAATGSSNENWVRWTEVADFYGSGARDRHYILDRLTGEIRFGDGASGMVPPMGSGNIRMPQYRTGGGASGNKPDGAITQLKTTVPYVESVTNYLAADGGADAETLDSLIDRTPRTVRHRDRAVTIEDYEDLAMLASGEIARVRCVPLFDLKEKPLAMSKEEREPGMVSLIIVPRSSDARPTPSIKLIDRVRAYLDVRRSPTTKLVIVGPKYVEVSVKIVVALRSMEGASKVEVAVAQALTSFLHPLTGGWDGKGWNFGSQPHSSALYSLIEAVAGVGHVRSLNVITLPEDADLLKTDRFLVYSGAHTITLSLESGVSSI
jgi:hypothetical protein